MSLPPGKDAINIKPQEATPRKVVPQSIWGVSSGDYSDYTVVAIFKTRELAEEWVKRHNTMGGHYSLTADIEEFDYYTSLPPLEEPIRVYTVFINMDGLSTRWHTQDFQPVMEEVPFEGARANSGGFTDPDAAAVGFSRTSYEDAHARALKWLNANRHTLITTRDVTIPEITPEDITPETQAIRTYPH